MSLLLICTSSWGPALAPVPLLGMAPCLPCSSKPPARLRGQGLGLAPRTLGSGSVMDSWRHALAVPIQPLSSRFHTSGRGVLHAPLRAASRAFRVHVSVPSALGGAWLAPSLGEVCLWKEEGKEGEKGRGGREAEVRKGGWEIGERGRKEGLP